MRIMLVDDQSIVLTSMRYLLASVGVESESFTDPCVALGTFLERPHDFDGIVTDLAMPTMRGDELARRVWEVCPDVPITILSGMLDDAGRSDFDGEGGVCMLAKPAPLSEIFASLRSQGLCTPECVRDGRIAAAGELDVTAGAT